MGWFLIGTLDNLNQLDNKIQNNFNKSYYYTKLLLVCLISTLGLYVFVYYIQLDLFGLFLIFAIFGIFLIMNFSLLIYVFLFLPFNNTTVFGNSFIFYILIIVFTYIVLSNKVKFSPKYFTIRFIDIFLLFTLLISTKDLIAYGNTSHLSFVFSLILLKLVFESLFNLRSFFDYFLAFGSGLITFGILQLLTGNVRVRMITPSSATFMLEGTYQPNYYGFYLLIFLVPLLFLKKQTKTSFILGVISIFLIFMVHSNTATATAIVLFFVKTYSILNKKTVKFLIFIVFLLMIISVFVILVINYGFPQVTGSRFIYTIQYSLKSGDLSYLTTSRIPIWSAFYESLKNRDVLELLFGKVGTEMIFVSELGSEKYLHNFFFDVINKLGIIGFAFFITYFLYSLFRIFSYLHRSTIRKIIIMLLLVLTIFSLTISFYSQRIVWAILLTIELLIDKKKIVSK